MASQLVMVNREMYWFPGRWLGGTSLIVAPLLLLTGVLLRIQFHFFFPQQLAAYKEHPALIAAAYSCFLAGNIALWPAIATLARLIGGRLDGWGTWGGGLVMFGLFARTFHAGVDHLAFQLVRMNDVGAATKSVAGAYGAFHVVSALSLPILAGWIVLALGAYRAGVLGIVRAVALGLMAGLMIGVLKGSSMTSVVATLGLCVALVPLGIEELRRPPIPTWREFVLRAVLLVVGTAAMFYVGQKG